MRAPPRRPQPVHHLLNRAGHLNPGGLGTRRPRQDLISQAGYQRSPRGTRKPRDPRHNAGAETSPEHARAAICHRPRSRPATFASVVPMRQRGTLIGPHRLSAVRPTDSRSAPPAGTHGKTGSRPPPPGTTSRSGAAPHQRNTLPSPSRQSSVGSQDSSLPNAPPLCRGLRRLQDTTTGAHPQRGKSERRTIPSRVKRKPRRWPSVTNGLLASILRNHAIPERTLVECISFSENGCQVFQKSIGICSEFKKACARVVRQGILE